MLKRIIVILVVLACAAGGIWWLYDGKRQPSDLLTLYGNVDIRQVDVGFRVGGRVTELFKEEGDAVKTGERLARLDAKPYEEVFDQAAAELSMQEIKEIRANIPEDLEIETFVHGAMCISYSGRCLLSSYFTGRDANQGACTHPCRWKYAVVEEKRPGEYLPVYENERGTYIFNSKDLCMIEHIPDLLDAGIDSFKIEGRMKTALYVATVARTYRKAIDDYLEDPKLYEEHMPWYRTQIASCTYRQFTTGFFYGRPDENTQIYDNNTYVKEYTYLGIVGEVDAEGRCRIEQRNKFSVGEQIEIMKPDGQNVEVTVKRILNEDGEEQESAPHSKQILHVELEGGRAEAYDILRRKE